MKTKFQDEAFCSLSNDQGSDLSKSNLARSNAWGEKTGEKPKKFSLHPRVKVCFMLEKNAFPFICWLAAVPE